MLKISRLKKVFGTSSTNSVIKNYLLVKNNLGKKRDFVRVAQI